MNLKKLAVAGAVAIASASSFAAAGDVIFSADGGKSYTGATASFTELSTYTGIGAGTFEVFLNRTGAIKINSVTFNGTPLVFSSPPPVWYLSGDFAGGDIKLEVKGSTTGIGSFSSVTSVTAVPEPETYALMLAGLGAIGFMARRRKA